MVDSQYSNILWNYQCPAFLLTPVVVSREPGHCAAVDKDLP